MTGSDSDDPPRPGVRPFLRAGSRRPAGGYRSRRDASPGPQQANKLRPFVITAGRTDGADPEIGLETQVTTTPAASLARLTPQLRSIVELCVAPVSVAEISARLRLHLGVVRILVGDLRGAGLLDVHLTKSESPDPETIMRVIRGLRAIN